MNTLFVLDEPSVGLHARDIGRVVAILRRLRDAGNTLLVVEHDAGVIRAADRILDFGPGPGERGGEVVFFGPPADLGKARRSLTADYLLGRRQVVPGSVPLRQRGSEGDSKHSTQASIPPAPLTERGNAHAILLWHRGSEGDSKPVESASALEILGAAEHNLRGIDVRIPLNRFVCVTGVSGSGKSTLIEDVLYRGVKAARGLPVEELGRHAGLRGNELFGELRRPR